MSSSPFNNPLVTVARAPITIGIIIIIIIIIILFVWVFSHQRYLMVFHWSLSDSKSPQVSRTLLSILADLNNAVVSTVSTRPLISKSSSLCTIPLVTVPSVSITVGTTVTFMFLSFFSSLARSWNLSLFSLSFSFALWSAGTAKSTIQQILSFLFFCLLFLVFFTITRSSRLAEIRWFVCIFKSHRILCISFSRMDSGVCIYHLFVWSNVSFLQNYYYYYYYYSIFSFTFGV